MKRIGKPVFFIVAVLILFLAFTSVFGIYGENGDFTITYIKGIKDIRWGIDIRGGVEAVFAPQDHDATDEEMQSVKTILDMRLVSQNITDYEIYPDYANDRITVRFPWKSDEKDFDSKKAIDELASTARLTFRPGNSYETQDINDNGDVIMINPTGETAETILLDGSDIQSARAYVDTSSSNNNEKSRYAVSLEMKDSGKEKFKEATTTYNGQTISIWMDNQMISYPTVNQVISDGKASITGDFTVEEATDLANKINAGALPFDLKVESHGTISPSLGAYALQAMAIAALAALAFIFLFMCIMYRVPGFVAFLALLGQLSISVIAVSGYFPVFPSFTMTIPGIAGMILSIGMGVDANIITAERIKDELWTGKTLDGCILSGTRGSLSAIIDGNITIIIVSVILILVFGPANIFSILFGVSTTGLIYAFGYTLLVGVIANFIMGVGASRLMLRSVSGLKFLRNKRLYGGKKKA